MFLNEIHNAYALVLDKRINFWEPLRASFQAKGINLQLFLAGDGSLDMEYSHIDVKELPPVYKNSINYATWYKSPNPYNAWLCHQKILEKTLMDGIDHVLLVEDDAKIEDDFDEIINQVNPFFKNNKYDMIYFGSYRQPSYIKETNNKNVLKSTNCGGLHACLLTKPIIELAITFPPIGPLDWTLGTYLHKWYDAYCIYPDIVTQKSGYSYIEQSNLEKPNRFKK